MTAPAITGRNEPMDPAHPRADSPRRRRTFTTANKIAHLTAYEHACEHGGGAYLRREGLYSSLICEWLKQRDAGVLQAITGEVRAREYLAVLERNGAIARVRSESIPTWQFPPAVRCPP